MKSALRALTLASTFATTALTAQQAGPAPGTPPPPSPDTITNYTGKSPNIVAIPARLGLCTKDGSFVSDEFALFVDTDALPQDGTLPQIDTIKDIEANAGGKAAEHLLSPAPADMDQTVLPELKNQLEKASAGLTTIFGTPFYYRLGGHFTLEPSAAACKIIPPGANEDKPAAKLSSTLTI